MAEGVSRVGEEEVDIDPLAAREYLTQPDKLLALEEPLVQDTLKRYNVTSLVCLGGFTNVRDDFDYEGLKLELDETRFEWGTLFEIECETSEPEQLRDKLEAFLKSIDVPFTYSASTKFANFRNRTLL